MGDAGLKYSLGIDIGTSSAKGVLFAPGVRPVAQATAEYETQFPHPGWAQQKPDDWWDATVTVIRELLGKSGVASEQIKVVSVSCQAPTVLLLDKRGIPLCDAIIWMDRRSEAECAYLADVVGRERIFEVTGTRLDPYYVYPELLWVKKNIPAALEQADVLLQVNGYINYKLTGNYSLDAVHASHTQMYDVQKHCWSEELFDAIGVSPSLFPQVTECTDLIGTVSAQAAALTGLCEGTAVLSGTVDGAAAVLEAGVTGGGSAVEMTGTSTGLMIAFDELKTSPNMAHQYSIVPGKHILYGAMSTTGASYKWARQQIFDHAGQRANAYADMDAEILREAPKPTELLFLPYLQGERCPLWDSNAKGVYFGLTLSTTRAQLLRATLEGVGFALRDNAEEAKKAGVSIHSLRSVGGCSTSELWTKIKASILNCPIDVPEQTLGAPGGLGMMMAVWLGEYESLEQAAVQCRPAARRVEPDLEWVGHYNKMYALYHAAYGCMKPLFDDLAQLQKSIPSENR